MPTNPTPTLPNRHTLYVGMTGSGKSQAARQNQAIPRTGARVMLWDHAHDHRGIGKTRYISDPAEYARHLKAGLKYQGFRLAYDGERSVAMFEWWCKLAWIIADGRRPLYLIVEELAAVSPGAGDATEFLGYLLNEGRKYGVILHATTQRPQEIAKTVYHNVETAWIGRQFPDNAQLMARRYGIPRRDIESLQPLEFIVIPGRAGQDFERVKLQYRQP